MKVGGGKFLYFVTLSLLCVPHVVVYLVSRNISTAFSSTVINFDHPNAFDWDLLFEHISMLKNGQAVEQPTYSYVISNRLKETIHVEPKPVIIIEGIMALHYKKLRDMMDLKIFVDTDSDVRLIRNIRRDVVERGRTVDMVLDRYEKVHKHMHEQFIEPTKKFADLIVPWGGDNRTGIHILKTYIEGIVTGV